MNVILYFQTPKNLNLPGSFFDALEYYLFSSQFNSNLHLYIFINKKSTYDRIIDTLNYRYDINFDYSKNLHILYYSKYIKEFIRLKINKLFFFDLISLKKLQQITPVYNKIYYVTEYTYPENVYMLKKKNVIYCSEMPFCYADKRIRMKFYFDVYKKIDSFENKLYVNYAWGDLKEVDNLIPKNKPLINKDKQYYPDLHKHFNEYLYIKSPYWYDTHPRLFHECLFYGKKFNYINNLGIKDGSWYRYNDAVENGLKDRNMNKEDWLIGEMINE